MTWTKKQWIRRSKSFSFLTSFFSFPSFKKELFPLSQVLRQNFFLSSFCRCFGQYRRRVPGWQPGSENWRHPDRHHQSTTWWPRNARHNLDPFPARFQSTERHCQIYDSTSRRFRRRSKSVSRHFGLIKTNSGKWRIPSGLCQNAQFSGGLHEVDLHFMR